ncbi:MAG: methionyl-tRNA formyltransferase [Elusimicrobia bacterium]|nr:methionyl-tRNA formyltransferase [Elusimicrobiota bacterium]
MRIVFFGTPQTAASHLNAIASSNFEIAGVVTQQDLPRGRGLKISPPPVKITAQETGVKTILQPEKLKDAGVEKTIAGLKADLGVVVAYGKIIPPSLLKIPRRGMINVHFSLIPKLRGPSPVEYAIWEGHQKTGVSTFWIDQGMDTGDLLDQRETEIKPTENARELLDRLTQMGCELLIDSLKQIEADRALKIPQDNAQASYCKKLTKESGRLDWAKPAQALDRQIRALAIWPGTYALLDGKKIQIIKAKATAENFPQKPGLVVDLRKPAGFLIKCGLGSLLVEEVKPEGGRAMFAWAYLQGFQKDLKTLQFK